MLPWSQVWSAPIGGANAVRFAELNLWFRRGGTSADWQLSESVTWDSADFTTASFAATDSNMNGGVNQSSPIYSYGMPLAGGYDANGNLLTASDSVMGQWTYSYDSLNRLTGAQAPVSQPAGVSGYFAGIASGWTPKSSHLNPAAGDATDKTRDQGGAQELSRRCDAADEDDFHDAFGNRRAETQGAIAGMRAGLGQVRGAAMPASSSAT